MLSTFHNNCSEADNCIQRENLSSPPKIFHLSPLQSFVLIWLPSSFITLIMLPFWDPHPPPNICYSCLADSCGQNVWNICVLLCYQTLHYVARLLVIVQIDLWQNSTQFYNEKLCFFLEDDLTMKRTPQMKVLLKMKMTPRMKTDPKKSTKKRRCGQK